MAKIALSGSNKEFVEKLVEVLQRDGTHHVAIIEDDDASCSTEIAVRADLYLFVGSDEANVKLFCRKLESSGKLRSSRVAFYNADRNPALSPRKCPDTGIDLLCGRLDPFFFRWRINSIVARKGVVSEPAGGNRSIHVNEIAA